MKHMAGIFPALMTPFTRQDDINETVLRQMVHWQLGQGVDGFFLCGSSSEAYAMTVEERKRVVEIVTDEVAGRCPLIAHIGMIATRDALDLARHAKSCGVDAMASVPPFYYRFSQEELEQYYLDLVDAVDLPMFLYNISIFTGVNFTVDNARRFLEDPRFAGMKHTCVDLGALNAFKRANPNWVLFGGMDDILLGAFQLGADGGIGSNYNALPGPFVKLYRLFREGRTAEAQALQFGLNEVLADMGKVGGFPSVKGVLRLMGLDVGDCRKPFRSLTEEDMAYLKDIVLPKLEAL